MTVTSRLVQVMADCLVENLSKVKGTVGNVEKYAVKIMKLDNLEKEMMKIHEAYSALKEHSEKREILEKSARSKLQAEVMNLTEANKELKERHEAIMAQVSWSINIPCIPNKTCVSLYSTLCSGLYHILMM